MLGALAQDAFRDAGPFAFQKLLLEHVLPLARRRRVEPVDHVLQEPEVEQLLSRHFKVGFDSIFAWWRGGSGAGR